MQTSHDHFKWKVRLEEAGSLQLLLFDTKIGSIMNSGEGYLSFQQDLNQLGRCAKEWEMELNSEKCEVFHFAISSQGMTWPVDYSPGECCRTE